MTGFGAAKAYFNEKEISIEIKAINSKTGDIRFRMPHRYSALEITLRRLVQQHAHRGKIDVTISTLSGEADDEYEINLPLFKSYYQSLQQTLSDLDAQDGNLASGILKIYNVVRPNTSSIADDEMEAIVTCTNAALDKLKDFRKEEGSAMKSDFALRCTNINEKIDLLAEFEEARTTAQREKLHKNLTDNVTDVEYDKNRFEQEIIYYLEKFDLTEEKVRLRQHCEFFMETLTNSDEVKGKSLAFISQEMGREINTLGSKANHHQIQRIVVAMKDELEKIKEQLANVV